MLFRSFFLRGNNVASRGIIVGNIVFHVSTLFWPIWPPQSGLAYWASPSGSGQLGLATWAWPIGPGQCVLAILVWQGVLGTWAEPIGRFGQHGCWPKLQTTNLAVFRVKISNFRAVFVATICESCIATERAIFDTNRLLRNSSYGRA